MTSKVILVVILVMETCERKEWRLPIKVGGFGEIDSFEINQNVH